MRGKHEDESNLLSDIRRYNTTDHREYGAVLFLQTFAKSFRFKTWLI